MKTLLMLFCAPLCFGAATIATSDGLAIKLSDSGGFAAQDYRAAKTFRPVAGKLARTGAAWKFTGAPEAAELALEAHFTPARGYIEVEGELRDTTGADRAIWLEFRLPVDAKGQTWWDGLHSTRIVAAGEYSTHDYPIAAVAGLALAIPPTEPSVFLAGCDASGLWLRWAFGLARDAKFASRARFKFRIFPVDRKWGFRDALEHYYTWFAEYYELTAAQQNLWLRENENWLHGGGVVSTRDVRIPERFTTGRRPGDISAGYLNLVGRIREVDTRNASTPERLAGIIRTADNFHWHGADVERGRAIIQSSSLHDPDGKTIVLMDFLESAALDFPLNPNPDLFADKPGAQVQGQFVVETVKRMAEKGLVQAVHFDTAGRWGAYLNYRREHFRYASYPLTFDEKGRVCLYNKISMYEMFRALREVCRGKGFGLEGAGMKVMGVKGSDSESEAVSLPGFKEDGRFFTAALIDSSWHEGNLNEVGATGYDFERTALGRKAYRISSGNVPKHYPAEPYPPPEQVRRALAQNTAWGVQLPMYREYFAAPEEEGYDPKYSYYYPRDKALWDRYRPANEAMLRAGWRPVTHAGTNAPEVVCERFGARAPYYFTVWSPRPPAQVRVTIDTAALGLNPEQASVTEIIQGVPLKVTRARELSIEVPMAKDWTRVLKVDALVTAP